MVAVGPLRCFATMMSALPFLAGSVGVVSRWMNMTMSASCSSAPTLAKVRQLGPLVRSGLRVPVELRHGDHRDLELLGQELERPADLGHLLLPAVVARCART